MVALQRFRFLMSSNRLRPLSVNLAYLIPALPVIVVVIFWRRWSRHCCRRRRSAFPKEPVGGVAYPGRTSPVTGRTFDAAPILPNLRSRYRPHACVAGFDLIDPHRFGVGSTCPSGPMHFTSGTRKAYCVTAEWFSTT